MSPPRLIAVRLRSVDALIGIAVDIGSIESELTLLSPMFY